MFGSLLLKHSHLQQTNNLKVSKNFRSFQLGFGDPSPDFLEFRSLKTTTTTRKKTDSFWAWILVVFWSISVGDYWSVIRRTKTRRNKKKEQGTGGGAPAVAVCLIVNVVVVVAVDVFLSGRFSLEQWGEMQRVRCKEKFIICTAIEEDAGTEGSKEDATTCLCATACALWSSYAVCTSVCSSFPSSMVPDHGSSSKRAWSW